ncbi:MAG: glycosyltransferase [Chloroflexi bacterium]|nr:glycosyltransferase [Chloroflexota bacterium]
MTAPTVAILIPMMNDWESLTRLIAQIDVQAAALPGAVEVHIMDDFSLPAAAFAPTVETVRAVHHHRLVRNLGHQRAIAVGLVLLLVRHDYDAVIVMDADGEDRPLYIPQLVKMFQKTGNIVVARRTRRSEKMPFPLFYWVYKLLFHLFTGHTIDFGNYCLIPRQHLRSLVYYPGLWNHLAATIVASRLPTTRVETFRGERYAGQSKMNFTALIIHGLSAISLFVEVVLVRLLITASLLGMAGMMGFSIVVMLRVFTDLAIPGWATTFGGILLVITIQSVIIIILLMFYLLQGRSSPQIVPARDTLVFLDQTHVVTKESATHQTSTGANYEET